MLAIDIGASGGRHFLGHRENGKLITEEIYRFENGPVKTEDGLIWDMEKILNEVLKGLSRCYELQKIPQTVAIDTWGVDYALLDENDRLLSPVYCYRDVQRQKAAASVEEKISLPKLYKITGIQHQPFNTVFQLYADRCSGKLQKARTFLQLPDYIAFLLTGKKQNEYTNATTTGMINARTKSWDSEIMNILGFDPCLFSQPLTLPTTEIGSFTPEVAQRLGYQATVIACPTHDTASAFAATSGAPHMACISSGTWSLVGMERSTPETGEEARKDNFTNEGGIEFRYRFLKNIVGMWLIQSIRKDTEKKYTYDQLMHMAQKSDFSDTFDVNDKTLVAPDDMCEAIRSLLGHPNLPLGDVLSSVYNSLAKHYTEAIHAITRITGDPIDTIQIVGGGSSDIYLSYLTQKYSGKKVLTGPKEATVLGNLASQMMYLEHISLQEAREILNRSFDVFTANA